MSWLSRLLGRPEPRSTFKEVDFWLRDALVGPMVSSGVAVNPTTAAAVPDVYACMEVLAQDVGRCPLKLRVKDVGGEWTDAEEHPLWELLHDLPNPEMTAAEFRHEMMLSLLSHEVAYAEIVRRPNGSVQALWPLDATRMRVTRNSLNVKQYEYQADAKTTLRWTFDASRPPLLELRHRSPVHRCRDLIGLAIALDTYAGKFFANGARFSGFVEAPGSIKPEQRQAISEMFRRLYSGVDNAHKVGVLEGGLKFTQQSASNDEAQFNETRKQIRTMIAGAFRVPPHKIGDLERATFSNIEAQDRDYVNSSLNPYLVLWEQAVRRDLLTTRQYPRYQAIFDREALIEADAKSRADALAVGRQNGWWSVNDVRRRLNENPVSETEGGNLYHMNGNFVPLTGAPEPQPAPASEPDPAGEAQIGQVM